MCYKRTTCVLFLLIFVAGCRDTGMQEPSPISHRIDSSHPAISPVQSEALSDDFDTIVVGTVKEVGIRLDLGDRIHRWRVVINVKEYLRGGPLSENRFVLYIHSPAREFGLYDNLDDLAGKACVWALKTDGQEIKEYRAPFLSQHFNEKDLDALRKALN